jgi:hypothetical protein
MTADAGVHRLEQRVGGDGDAYTGHPGVVDVLAARSVNTGGDASSLPRLC